MTLYDQVLNAPDTQTRQQALDKLCLEVEIRTMRKIARNMSLAGHIDRVEILDNADEMEKDDDL